MITVFEHSNDSQNPFRLLGAHDPDARIVDVIDVGDDEVVFVEDQDEPVDVATSLKLITIDQAVHLHRHRRHRIAVTVEYNGQLVKGEFSPATRIAKIRRLAIRQLRLDASTDLELRLSGTTEGLDEGTHLGSLAAGHCEQVELLLVPGDRFHG